MDPQDFLPPEEAFDQTPKGPPKPFLDLSDTEVEEKLSSINRVTFRLTLVRERGGESPQVFPESGSIAAELPVEHREPAFFMPDRALNGVWKVNTGWVEHPTLIVIYNKTAWKGVAKPTPKQKEEVEASLVAVGFSEQQYPIVLRPGECQPLFLTSGQQVYVHAVSGNPTISVFAV